MENHSVSDQKLQWRSFGSGGSVLQRLARASFYASSGINEFFRLRTPYTGAQVGTPSNWLLRGVTWKRVTPFTTSLSPPSEMILHSKLARGYGELATRDICVRMISKYYGSRYYVCSRASNINSVAQLLC